MPPSHVVVSSRLKIRREQPSTPRARSETLPLNHSHLKLTHTKASLRAGLGSTWRGRQASSKHGHLEDPQGVNNMCRSTAAPGNFPPTTTYKGSPKGRRFTCRETDNLLRKRELPRSESEPSFLLRVNQTGTPGACPDFQTSSPAASSHFLAPQERRVGCRYPQVCKFGAKTQQRPGFHLESPSFSRSPRERPITDTHVGHLHLRTDQYFFGESKFAMCALSVMFSSF